MLTKLVTTLMHLQDAARRAHQRLAAEENRQLILEKAQRAMHEEQYAKDVTRHEQETEVHTLLNQCRFVLVLNLSLPSPAMSRRLRCTQLAEPVQVCFAAEFEPALIVCP